MHSIRLVVGAAALLIAGGCTEGRELVAPTARPDAASALAARQVDASGAFDANVDFTTLTLTPRGNNCLLVVEGQLVFTGTIEGIADARTSALVFAPCEDVATTPPGTYPDVFRSELVFTGTVDGTAVEDVTGLYLGRSEPGGHIDARFVFSNGMAGSLDVDAQLAVGGTYDGAVVVH